MHQPVDEIDQQLKNGEGENSHGKYQEPVKVGYVLNGCFGGFGLSEWALDQLKDSAQADGYNPRLERTNKRLIELIQKHGSKVNGSWASLYIQYMPEEYYKYDCYTIDEYDGGESLVLQHEKYMLLKIKEILYNEQLSYEERISQQKHFIENFTEVDLRYFGKD